MSGGTKVIYIHSDHQSMARIQNLPAPVDPNEPVRLVDLQQAIEGLAWKDNVRVAAPGTVNLAAPGVSLDGISMVAGDRFLAANQTTPVQNGIYVWNGAAAPATRSFDASTGPELVSATVIVDEGTAAGTAFRQTATNIVVGTTVLGFAPFGSSTPPASTGAAGSIALATQAEVDAGVVGNKAVTPNTLKNSSLLVRQMLALIGDNTATQYDVTHNFNSRAVQVEVYRNSGLYDSVGIDVSRPDANTVRINSAIPIPVAALAVVIQGK